MNMRINQPRHDDEFLAYIDQFTLRHNIVIVPDLRNPLPTDVDRTRTNCIRQYHSSSANYQIRSTHSKIGGGGGRFDASVAWASPNTCSYAVAIAPYEIGNTRNIPT